MATTAKQRIIILIVVFLGYIGALGLSALSQRFENQINYQEAYFFEGNQQIAFDFQNASSEKTHALEVESQQINTTHTQVQIRVDDQIQGEFSVNPAGWIYINNTLQEEIYSVWWIYIPNVQIFFGVEVGDNFTVIDPTGFFGEIGQQYVYKVEDKYVFYPVLPEHRNLMGAQASFEAGLYTQDNNKKIGTFLFDTTSGAMEQADYLYKGSQYRMLLTDTSYGISRNRFVLVVFNLILGILISALWAIIGKNRQKKNKSSLIPSERYAKVEFFLLLGSGFLCKTLDIVDTWFYHRISFLGTIAIDIGFSLILSAICFRGRYGLKWTFPSWMELIYARPHRGRQIIPFAGNFLGWLAVLWASGLSHPLSLDIEDPQNIVQNNEGKKKKRKIWIKLANQLI